MLFVEPEGTDGDHVALVLDGEDDGCEPMELGEILRVYFFDVFFVGVFGWVLGLLLLVWVLVGRGDVVEDVGGVAGEGEEVDGVELGLVFGEERGEFGEIEVALAGLGGRYVQ